MTFPIEINARVQIGDSVQGHLIQLHGGITVLLGPNDDRKTFNLALDLLSLGNGPSAVSKETGLSRQTLIRIRDNPEAASAAMHRWGL